MINTNPDGTLCECESCLAVWRAMEAVEADVTMEFEYPERRIRYVVESGKLVRVVRQDLEE